MKSDTSSTSVVGYKSCGLPDGYHTLGCPYLPADPKDRRIAELEAQSEVDAQRSAKRYAELLVENLRFRSALREIAEHPHINASKVSCDSPPGSHYFDYLEGESEGHRCAAEIARKALAGK